MAHGLVYRQLLREKQIIFRQKHAILQPFLFFLMFIAFFPLILPFNLQLLHAVCGGVVWMSLTIALFLAAERFYLEDSQCGYLEQWLIYKVPVYSYVLCKWLVHGVVQVVGVLFCMPIIAVMYQLNFLETYSLLASILCGMPALLAMCGLVSAFGPNRSILMLLILFPLIIPILMLGSGAFASSALSAYLALLLALSIGMVFILSIASAAILKISLENT